MIIFYIFLLTLTKGKKSCDGVSQDPCVTTELEQVIGENVDQPKAVPAGEEVTKIFSSKDFIILRYTGLISN